MFDEKHKIVLINGEEKIVSTAKIVVHRFSVGDVEDPVVYAAEPILEWEKSPMGQWVKKNSVSVPEWRRSINPSTYSCYFAIIAELEMPKITEFYLRWGTEKL